MQLRKLTLVREEVHGHYGACIRVAGIAVVANPLTGSGEEDLVALADLGASIGHRLIAECLPLLNGQAVHAYGKGVLVGTAGVVEHGAGVIHPKLGQRVRAAIGGGAAIMCSTVKVATVGATLDIPIAHKDDIWNFDFLDTMTVMLADAPLPNELMVAIVVSHGGRPDARASIAATTSQ